MQFRSKSPEKPITQMDEEELARDMARSEKRLNHIQAKREKDRARTTLGFSTGLKALGLLGGAVLLTSLSGSFLFGLAVAVALTGGLIYRGVMKDLKDESVLTMRRQVSGGAMQYFRNMRADPGFKAKVLDSIADDFNAGAKEKVTVLKPLTLQMKKPGLFQSSLPGQGRRSA